MGNHNFNHWSKVASKGLESACLYNANRRVKPSQVKATPNVLEHIGNENQKLIVLDFGCGFGRNAYHWAMERPNWLFFGYDCPEMLNNSLEYHQIHYGPAALHPSNLTFEANWNSIMSKFYDVVVADNVFGHIQNNEEVREILNEMYTKCSNLIVVNDPAGVSKIAEILGDSREEKILSDDIVRFTLKPTETPKETPVATPDETPVATPEETPVETPTETPEVKKKEPEDNQ